MKKLFGDLQQPRDTSRATLYGVTDIPNNR